MGTALIHGWHKADLLQTIEILDPSDLPKSIQRLENVFHMKQEGVMDFKRPQNETDIVVLAVKPQVMGDIMVILEDSLPEDLPVLSIAAGKNIAYFQDKLGPNQPIIRTMPNTPAAVGKGITAMTGTNITDEHKEMANALFNAVGETMWMNDESLMDAVTAISGSGPAYVFYLIEALSGAGQKIGLSEEQAMTLARQTVIGAAGLAEQEKDSNISTLRQNVTSPGGTTEAALDILMDGDFKRILDKAVTAARDRGKELSS